MAQSDDKKEMTPEVEQPKQPNTRPKHRSNRERQPVKRTRHPQKEVQTKEAPVNAEKLEKTIEEVVVPQKELIVQRVDQSNITIDGELYEIIKDHRDAFDAERLSERYSSILEKYDYIVGDWGFEQLRLKGFYHNQNRKVPQDKKISQLEDYLYEYCNFGAPYFVLQRLEQKKNPSSSTKSNRRKKQKRKNITNRKSTYNPELDEYATTENASNKRENRNPKKKNFIKKEVLPDEKNAQSEKEAVVVKTVKDEKGSRRFNIRRNDVDKAKNKS